MLFYDAGNVVKVVSSVPGEEKPKALKEDDVVEKNASVTVYLCGVPIPKGLIGETEENAQKTLSDLGFKVNTTYDETTGTYGTVINLLNAKGTKPLKAGTVLKKGTALMLLVSQYVPQQQQPVYTEPIYTPPVTPDIQPEAPDSGITID